ncbi:hypothetical protein SDC9_87432 [bioreactor metagenome]|uniref:Uncharacterized protein n=1 Tax=bioreactor metagenome TaxID=1076179 RepID=A0A644ZT88_9ZZZZ
MRSKYELIILRRVMAKVIHVSPANPLYFSGTCRLINPFMLSSWEQIKKVATMVIIRLTSAPGNAAA